MADYNHIVYLREQRTARARRRVTHATENLRIRRQEHQQLEAQKEDFLLEIQMLERGLMNALLEKTVTINDVLRVDEIMRIATQRAESLADKVNEALTRLKDATAQHQRTQDAMTQCERKHQKSLEVLARTLTGPRLRFLRQDEDKIDEYINFTIAKRAMHE